MIAYKKEFYMPHINKNNNSSIDDDYFMSIIQGIYRLPYLITASNFGSLFVIDKSKVLRCFSSTCSF